MQAKSSTYKMVIFDFDGTLVDSFPWFTSVLNGVADRYRFRRVGSHEGDRLRAMTTREILRDLGIPAWKLPFITRHMRRLAARDSGAMRMFEGVTEMVRALADQGLTLAIVSSNTEATIRNVLGPDLSSLFRHYACGASMFGKAPKLRQVLKRARVAPGEAIVIGDEVRDGEAASEVGLAFGAVTWGFAPARAFSPCRPTVIFRTVADIVPGLTAAGA